MKHAIAALSLVLAFFFIGPAWAGQAEDHDALRKLRQQAAEALNTNDFELIKPLVMRHFTITTVDNQVFTNLNDFKTYWQGLFNGKNAALNRIEINPSADELTQFLTPDVGLVHGTSNDAYYFSDGDTRKMKIRWAAVVKREADGWKIATLNFSANILDNPVLTAFQSRLWKYTGIGTLAGLIVGYILTLRMRRRFPAA